MKSFKQHLNENKHRLVHSFDDVNHGEPVRIQAFHGTSPDRLDKIKEQGFRHDKDVQKHGFSPKMASTFKHSQGEGNATQLLGQGVYFADSKNESAKYGIPQKVEVTLHNPYVIHHGTIDQFRNLNHQEIKAKGHDGIVVKSGRYGLFGGENYRQAVAFNPKNVKIIDKFESPKEWVKGAKVKHKETGEIGKIKMASKWNENHKHWIHQNKPDLKDSSHWISVHWSGSKKLGTKSRTEHNIPNQKLDFV